MKDEDQSSVYLDNNFKPPDRCEDNYYEFYSKYQNPGGKGLPPPLENQPFLIDRSYVEEDEHLITPSQLPQSHTSSHQQQIQQLQHQIQQQQHQIQQQQALQQHLQLQQQQFMQQHPSQIHSPHNSHQQHLHHMQHPQQPLSQHPQQQPQQHMQQPHHHQQQQQQQMHHPHSQPMHQQMHAHPHQQQQQMHQPFQQMHVQPQPHMRGLNERSYSVPDARNPLPRSTSNPSYSMRSFDTVQEKEHDDLSGDSARTIWTPHPRGMVSGLNDYLDVDDGIHNKHARLPHAGIQHHRTPPLPQHPQSRDPNNYYAEDFDNVAYSTANQLLKEDNLGIGGRSIWNDRAFDSQQQVRPQQMQGHKHSPHITAPTPTVPSSHTALMDLLSNGLFPPAPTADSMLRGINRRRSHSGGVGSIPPPTTSPPLLNAGSASTSPALPICRYYAQGFCSRGERCNFLHDEQSQQALALQQNSGNDQFTITKPKAKKTVASPPPLSMSNMPPKVPSPVNNNMRNQHMGNGHHGNGMGNGRDPSPNAGSNTPNNNATLSSIINSLNTMNLDSRGSRDSGRLSPSSGMLGLSDIIGGGNTSPQPRSVTPNSSNLADVFANGGSTSPNGKSDLTRQYTSIEQVIGHIYSLCKDQHGCRFLQKKLEDRDSMIVEIIFNEVYDHMTELMIDPFGNYLCQKLLEHCNDDQRLDIIEKVAPDLVKISKNMHGTRAVQKMIEYLTTPEQIAIAKKALSNHVVTLIQDLNGNHVIQRCLNRLSPQDNQFIYDSVSQAGHCVEVATHRHGCCVLQRCIDHASDSQKIQLINEIIANALVLVQDPYGNYVVQYVLDLPFPGLASRLARRFLGHIPILSTQKFSSNVVEKCIQCLNVTDVQTRAAIIQELVEYDNLLYLLQDPYANYVIQTSLNVSEPVQHARLVEAIRPHLTSLRNTPYGKRIQNKILKESSRDYYA